MKNKILSIAILLAMFSCADNEILQAPEQPQKILSKKEINTVIKTSIETTGDFNWTVQESHLIWSALMHGEGILTIGYGKSKNNFARNTASNTIKDALIKLVRTSEKESAKGNSELYVNEIINVIDIKVSNKETIELLLKDSRVRYIEPSNYVFLEENSQEKFSTSSFDNLGCGYRPLTLNSNDYRTIVPGAKVPWSFDAHNIPSAWDYSTGAGVSIAIIDSGLSPEQKWMNTYFNDGYSTGRTVEKYGTFVDSWWPWSDNYDGVDDKCGHGTKMAAVATAPRNNDNLPLGVAYNANLVSYRAVENVLINDYHEKRGVVEALTALADRSDVKVISMSIGAPFSIGNVSDAIRYAHSRGKMILAAGGTSTSYTNWFGVIFPAKMSETIAVTGVKENQYAECDVCHTGSKIDFTIQMQRTNGTNNKIPVLSYYDEQSSYMGGSSIATATTAGIAALVWSKHPNWSREQVLQKLKESADFYPNKHSEFGYGNIDALMAVQ